MGTQLPQKKGHSPPPQFLAHVYCGRRAGWIKTPLDAEVNLSTGERGTADPPLFGPCLVWPQSPISATAELFFYIYIIIIIVVINVLFRTSFVVFCFIDLFHMM